jgi:hypothetical protein
VIKIDRSRKHTELRRKEGTKRGHSQRNLG